MPILLFGGSILIMGHTRWISSGMFCTWSKSPPSRTARIGSVSEAWRLRGGMKTRSGASTISCRCPATKPIKLASNSSLFFCSSFDFTPPASCLDHAHRQRQPTSTKDRCKSHGGIFSDRVVPNLSQVGFSFWYWTLGPPSPAAQQTRIQTQTNECTTHTNKPTNTHTHTHTRTETQQYTNHDHKHTHTQDTNKQTNYPSATLTRWFWLAFVRGLWWVSLLGSSLGSFLCFVYFGVFT